MSNVAIRAVLPALWADSAVTNGDFTETAGLSAAGRLLENGLPTAVVCANDRIAVGMIDGLRRAGVDVPGRVSVAGYDDSVLARLGHIDLTSVSQQPREQASRAVQDVVQRLDGGRTEAQSSVLLPALVVRGTTAPPNQADGGRPDQAAEVTR